MSNIPSSSVSDVLTPVVRATNEALRARTTQSLKNAHHSEEVDELDETAVNSVGDQGQGKNRQKNPDSKKRDEPEERVEIEALAQAPPAPAKGEAASHALDISA